MKSSLRYGFKNSKDFYKAYNAEMHSLIRAQEERAKRADAETAVQQKVGEEVRQANERKQ